MRAGTPLGGHIVQGHVDGTGRLLALRPVRENAIETTDWWLEIEMPKPLEKYVVEKGSITVEGISLTVATVQGSKVAIAIIPHTYKATNLRALKPGDPVNLEVDILAKYAEKVAAKKAQQSKLTIESLVTKGF